MRFASSLASQTGLVATRSRRGPLESVDRNGWHRDPTHTLWLDKRKPLSERAEQ